MGGAASEIGESSECAERNVREMYWELFSNFFRIGLFTIGGGYAMIPLIQQRVVDQKQWVSGEELMDLMAVAQSCPGIFAVNISIFIGYKLRGVKGALCSTLGACLPSFVIILIIAMLFHQFGDNEWVARFFRGIRPAVVALIAAPVFKMAKTAQITRKTVWIPVAVALAIWWMGVSPIYVIMIAGLAGYAYGQLFGDGDDAEENNSIIHDGSSATQETSSNDSQKTTV